MGLVDTIVSSTQARCRGQSMFRYPIGILPADIDHMGHVNNSVYLKWVQDAVVRYWESAAPSEAVTSHLWVALKHEISTSTAFLEDSGLPRDREQMRASRFLHHVVKRARDVAPSQSIWCASMPPPSGGAPRRRGDSASFRRISRPTGRQPRSVTSSPVIYKHLGRPSGRSACGGQFIVAAIMLSRLPQRERTCAVGREIAIGSRSPSRSFSLASRWSRLPAIAHPMRLCSLG